MTAKKTENPQAETPEQDDEAGAPEKIEGRCNAIVRKGDGTLDRCSRPEGHATSHLGWIQRRANLAKRNESQKEFSAWRRENDPGIKAREEAKVQKDMATLTALAEKYGYRLVEITADQPE